MLDNLATHAYVTAFIIASIGLVYVFDRAYNEPYYNLSEYIDASSEPPPTQDISASVDTVPTASTEQYFLDPPEQCCMVAPEKSEPPSNLNDNVEAVSTPGHKRNSFDYKHEFWPSPRPVNFVKALVKGRDLHTEGRINHAKAIEILSSRAGMKIDDFLRVDPITYIKIFMPAQYNATVLLGPSVKRIEDTLRRHLYLDTLRRHG